MTFHTALPALLTLCISTGAFAAPQSAAAEIKAFESRLTFRSGKISLADGVATLNTPANFRYLDAQDARILVTEGWGNPPQSAEGVWGMLVPKNVSPLAQEGWGIVITYVEDGYVDDKDAAEIDYAELLEGMQDAQKEENKQRVHEGYDPLTIVGWAEPPSYDASSHKLYWAQELSSPPDDGEHTLNYDIRILGRRGVLVLSGVAGMSQIDQIRKETRAILPAIEFTEGNRYEDFTPSTDRVAAYGIGGLIAGTAAVKMGFFKLLWVGILGFKKLIIGLVIAGLAALKFLWSKK